MELTNSNYHTEYTQRLSVARASWRRLRASLGNSLSRALEVLPHYYGTSTNDPSYRATESVLSEAHPDGRAGVTAVESGCIGRAGVDRHQFSHVAGIDRLRREAAGVLGIIRAASARGAGDRWWESLGKQEARVEESAFLSNVTRSGVKRRCPHLQSLHRRASTKHTATPGNTSSITRRMW
jgi:hypothetical protein